MAGTGEDEALPELCDLCGMTISDGSELYGLAPDSSVIHARDPQLDGKRRLIACCAEHMAQLQAEYKRRPFIEEELWAGKMSRALCEHDGMLSFVDMLESTGLTVEQMDRAVEWNNEQVRRHRRAP